MPFFIPSMPWSTWWPTMTRTSWRGCWSGARGTGWRRRWSSGKMRATKTRWRTRSSKTEAGAGKECVWLPARAPERVSWARSWRKRMSTRKLIWERTRSGCRSCRDTLAAPGCFTVLAGEYLRLQKRRKSWMFHCSPGAGGRQAGGGPGGSEATSRHLAAAKQWDGPGFQHILQIQHNFVHLGQKLSDLQGLHKTTLSFFGNPRGTKDPRRGRHRSEWPQRPPASWSIEKGFRPGGGGVYHNHKRKGLWIARLT